MGLLDEAIRDHLELKRRQGADPTDLARAEREALEPVFPDESHREEPEPLQDEGESDSLVSSELPPEQLSSESVHEEPSRYADDSTVGQETAEMDVQAFLDAEAEINAANQLPEQIPGQERLTFE